jgi:hypothetical protein
MPMIGDTINCPNCSRPTLERQVWKSTMEKREECCECGYFYEETQGVLLATQLGIFDPEGGKITDVAKLESVLKQMHFDVTKHPYCRKGFIPKDGSNRSEYLVANTWFSSPSNVEALDVQWEQPGYGVQPTVG